MDSALIVMAILGCGDGGDRCQTVRVEPTSFATVDQCNSAAATTVARYTGLTYPVIAVRCQKSDGPVLVEAEAPPTG